jgi:mannose-1-phosphate guanylyltransferase/mannose-6-phosphate isomerase
MSKIYPVVISGGSGTRLWPLSRRLLPKQFTQLIGEESLFTKTVKRVQHPDYQPIIVVCNEDHKFLAKSQLLDEQHSLSYVEPQGRNTAPAVAMACNGLDDDDILLVLPADHLINNETEFQNCLDQAINFAKQGNLVTFGIKPTSPQTGYGYIKHSGNNVDAFIEKPDAETALHFLSEGCYLWNSGIFVFRVGDYKSALAKFHPKIITVVDQAIARGTQQDGFVSLDEDSFKVCEDISIDYAVMEKSDNIKVIPADIGWSDIGSFDMLHQVLDNDDDDNATVGDVMLDNCQGSYLNIDKGLMVAIGLKDVVAVSNKDATLIVHKDYVQDVRKIVEKLRKQGRTEHLNHTRVHRPWGSYEDIDGSKRDRVKRIIVNPGKSLSLQKHHHRAEHWVVVKGSAKVINGDREIFLTEDQSTYIPVGQKHRLINEGKIPLEMIEVQTGSYLGEDDIVRFEDAWGRK